jgi:hypothetical protein
MENAYMINYIRQTEANIWGVRIWALCLSCWSGQWTLKTGVKSPGTEQSRAESIAAGGEIFTFLFPELTPTFIYKVI